MVVQGINLKKQAVVFQAAHKMSHNINTAYGKIPIFYCLLKKRLGMHQFYLKEMYCIGLNVF